jgi:uncharacterized repeat protein (TIGR01451 family)
LLLFGLGAALWQPTWPAHWPVVEAAIDNNQPSQPFASVVDCIRTGPDQGEASSRAPRFAVTCYASAWDSRFYGEYNNPTNGDAPPDDPALIAFGDATPDGTVDLGDNPGGNDHAMLAQIDQVGSIYGLAYASGTNPASPFQAQLLFSGAYTKRITRFSSHGPGAILVTNLGNSNTRLFAQIPNVVPGPIGAPGNPGDGSSTAFPNGTTTANYLPSMGGIHTPQHDEQSLSSVGRTGLGDLALSNDERTLFAVNINNRRVYVIDTWTTGTPAPIVTTTLPDVVAALQPCQSRGGTANYRPFALHVADNRFVYLGGVCSAETTSNRADLAARVDRYDLATGQWSNVLGVGLTDFDAQRGANLAWQPWRNSVILNDQEHNQPMLSDIVITERGSMILGLRDRYGDLGTTARVPEERTIAQGDLVLATAGGPGWVPQTANPEHYTDQDTGSDYDHPESTWGGLAYVPGTHAGTTSDAGEIVTTWLAPYRRFTGGTAWFNTNGGAPTAQEEIYPPASEQLGKTAGLGDIELLCTWRAIGDRVWRDNNGNGVQDAGEPAIDGVRVQLFAQNDTGFTNPLATVTTGSILGASGSWRFYVNPFLAYQVRIDPAMFGPGQPLAGLGLTTRNVGDAAADSDADANGVILIPSAYHADVNLTFDAGLSVGANVRVAKTAPAQVGVGTPLTFTLNYANDGPSPATNVVLQDTLPAGVFYVSATPAPSTISGSTLTWNLGNVLAGRQGTISINTQVTLDAPGQIVNNATISTTTPGDSPTDNTTTSTTTVLRPDIVVQKTAPLSAVTGSQFDYTLTYSNRGSATADGVTLLDTLPAGVTFVSATPPPGIINGDQRGWVVGTLGTGQTGSITLRVQVAANAPGHVVNNATISTTTPGDDPTDNTTTTTTNIVRPNVTITKRSSTTVTAGQPLAYTLDYRNSGTATAQTVVVVDTLPAGVTFVSASPPPSAVNGSQLSWNLGDLGPSAQGSITVNTTASATLANGTLLTNQAQISTTTSGDDPGDNGSTTNTTVQRADLYISKSSPTSFPVLSGSHVTYVLDYGNNGPATATNVQLVDSVPAQLRDVTWMCVSGCSASGSGNNINIALGGLVAGATGRVEVRGIATTSLARENFMNTASISGNTPEISTSNNQSTVPGAVWTSDLQVVKLASPQVFAGETLTATLSYRNNGPASASNIVLSDTLPTGVTLVSSMLPASQNGQTLSWNLGDVSDNTGGTIQLVLRTDAALPDASTLINRAAITTTTPDRDPQNNTSQASTVVLTKADLVLDKQATTAVVRANETTSFVLRYRNAGPSLARMVELSDTLPAELRFGSSDPAPSNVAGQALRWNLGDLAPGTTGTITVEVQAPASQIAASQTYTNTATIGGATTDPDPTNNTATAAISVATIDLSVVKAMPPQALAGSEISATLRWRNAGPALAANVVLTDTLPVGLSLISAEPLPTTATSDTLRWELGDLAGTASGEIALRLRVAATLTATQITNRAEISRLEIDRQWSNNVTSASSVVQRSSDLAVFKSNGLNNAQPGDQLRYTITATNHGPALASGVVLREHPPLTATLLAPGWARQPDGSYSFAIGDLAVGQTVTQTLLLSLPNPLAVAEIANTATITSSIPDPDLRNNTSTDRDAIMSIRLGDLVWNDRNGDGLQDPDEPGLPNVVIQLLDAQSLALLATTSSDANGNYLFSGLRPGNYAVQVVPETTRLGSYLGYRFSTGSLHVANVTATSQADLTLDFGLRRVATTDVALSFWRATRQGNTVLVSWQTSAESNTRGFRVLRATTAEESQAIEIGWLASQGALGGTYQIIDQQAPERVFYWLIEEERSGQRSSYGPIWPTSPTATRRSTFVPLIVR